MAELTLQTRKAAAGAAWVRAGLRLFVRQPLVTVLTVSLGWLITLSIALVPVVGTAFALIMVPATSVGMLGVCRSVALGEMPGIANYTAALKDPFARMQLLKIGVYYALVAGVLGVALSFMPAAPAAHALSAPAAATTGADAATDATAGADTAAATPAADSAPALPDLTVTPERLLLALVLLLVAVPLEMSIWFAPIFSAWHGMGAGKALFYSLFGCWRNRAPMLVYLLALAGIAFVAVLAFGAVIGAFNIREGVALYLLAPLPLSLLAISKTCAYEMYRDLAGVAPAPPPAQTV
jgi:hypothetical protein